LSEEVKNREYNQQLKSLSAKQMAKDFISKLSVNTPTKGLKDVDSATMSSL
jgi:hypothetical protein